MRRAMCKVAIAAALSAGLLGVSAAPAAAQDPPVAVTGGLDVTNQYNFRGIRQNFGGVSIWPFVDVGIPVFGGDGALKSVTINLGTWNAIHTDSFGDAVDGEDKFYESDLYATLGLGFDKAALGFTYTAYTSPQDFFNTVHELAVKVSFDDSGALGQAALKPYGLVAFELTDEGQADAGSSKGVYVELGIAPGISSDRASVAFPVKVGLSAKDYYELKAGGEDAKFGYFSVASIVTVPLGPNWNVHGGGELQLYGDRFTGFGDSFDRKWSGIGSIGIGFSY